MLLVVEVEGAELRVGAEVEVERALVGLGAVEAALGAASGAVVGYLASPKQKKTKAIGIGALAGMGLQIAMRGVTLGQVLPPERRTPFRILTIGAGAGAVIGAGYLAFKKETR